VRERLPSSLRLSPTREREIVDELAQHLDDRWRELVSSGASPEHAEALALAEFRDRDRLARFLGPLRQAQTAPPLAPGAPADRWIDALWRDVRYAVRIFRRHPGFTLVATLTLALGIGANTAIFSLVDAVLLRTLPVDRPHELVFFRTIGSEGTSGAPPYPWFERVREDAATFAGMAVFASDEMRIDIDGRAEQVFGQSVSGSFFDTLGIEPAAGRLLRPDDEKMAPPVAVIDYGYWQRRFGGSSGVIGRTIRSGPRTYTIVGVTPPGFSGLLPGRHVELTTPIAEGSEILKNGRAWWCQAVARLRPGVTPAQAAASADTAFQAHMQTVPIDPILRRTRFQRVDTVPAARGLDGLRDRYSTFLAALMALALAALLVACGNLATLLLVRGEARAREIAIRQASGASTSRLLRQMLTETLLLFALGAAAGLVVARVAVDALVAFFAIGRNAIELQAVIDWRAATFAAGAALVAAVLTGLWPAVRALCVQPQDAMRSGDLRLAGSPRARAATRILVVGQVMLCFTLLVSAMLFVRTMTNLRHVELGFTPERVLTQSIDPMLPGPSAEYRPQFWARVLERMQTLPGARAVSLSILTPLSGRSTAERLSGPGLAARLPADGVVHVNHVSEGYFTVFGIGLLHGRPLTMADRTARVALVNETTETQLFPGRSAVGETLQFGGDRSYRIVGVVEDSKHLNLREPKRRMVYLPLWQPLELGGRVTLSVATEQEPMTLASEIARQVREIEPTTLVSDVFDVETQIDATLIGERLLTMLGIAFALLALALTAIGVYGVLSCSVAERRGEIALRMALGALPSRVGRDIWGEVQWLLVTGITLGVPAAWATSRLVQALLFDVTPLHIGTYALAIGVLVGVAAAAALFPVLRAASLNPADVTHR
jgi:putative ABC transport system permease protein